MKKLDVLAATLLIVGVAAVYQIAQQSAIRRRWSREPSVTTA